MLIRGNNRSGRNRGTSVVPWTPKRLFSAGEQGVWFDASDTTTLFQDAAGKTPVTAFEQPVGLWLDKSRGLAFGPELVTNGTFDTDTSGWTPGGTATIAWDAGRLAVISGGATANNNGNQTFPTVVGRAYRLSYFIDGGQGTVRLFVAGLQVLNQIGASSGQFVFFATTTTTIVSVISVNNPAGARVFADDISVRELPGNHATQATAASRPVYSARYNLLLGTETLATQSVTTVATSHVLRFTGAGTVTLSGTATGTFAAGTHTVTCTAGALTCTVSGSVTQADLRPSNVGALLPPYQRVTTSTDYDTAGFPAYLRFDGVDDGMFTGNIDFTSTDKMTVIAGVRKLSDASSGKVVEFSIGINMGPNGAFTLDAPGGIPGTERYVFGSRGTTSRYAVVTEGFGAPTSHVLAGISDISGGAVALRVNSIQVATSAADQGAGNYGKHQLFIGRRNNASLPFNGNLYGLVIRGAQTTLSDISRTERLMAQKSGIVF